MDREDIEEKGFRYSMRALDESRVVVQLDYRIAEMNNRQGDANGEEVWRPSDVRMGQRRWIEEDWLSFRGAPAGVEPERSKCYPDWEMRVLRGNISHLAELLPDIC